MKSITKLIKNIDIYGKTVELNVNGKKSANSNFGGLCSILFMSLLLVIILINLNDFLFIREPYISILTIPRIKGEIYLFDEDNFFVSHLLYDLKENSGKNFTPIESQSINYNFTPSNRNSLNESKKFAEFTICENNEKLMNSPYKYVYEKLSKFNLEYSMSCMNFTQPFYMGGHLLLNTSYLSAKMTVKYDVCNIIDEKEKICSKDTLDSYDNYRLSIIYKNNYFSKISNKGHESTFQNKMYSFNLNKDYFVKIKVKKINVYIDNNILYNIFPKKESSFFEFDFQIFELSKKKKNSDLIVNINHEFVIDDFIDIIEINFIKLDEMLAYIGSIVTIVDFITKFFSQFFTEGNLENSIYKQIFYLKKKNQNESGNFFNFNVGFNKEFGLELKNKKEKLIQKQEEFVPNKKMSIFIQDIGYVSNKDHEGRIDIKEKLPDEFSSEKYFKKNEESNTSENKDSLEMRNINLNQQEKNYQNKHECKLDLDVNKKEKDSINFKKIFKEKTIKKSMFVNFYKFIIPCYMKNKVNIRLLIKIKDFVNEELDTVKILKKIIEYENFKEIYLSKNQCLLFNLLQKRIITEENLDQDAKTFYNKFYFENRMKTKEEYRHLVDNLFDFDDKNEHFQNIVKKIKDIYKI